MPISGAIPQSGRRAEAGTQINHDNALSLLRNTWDLMKISTPAVMRSTNMILTHHLGGFRNGCCAAYINRGFHRPLHASSRPRRAIGNSKPFTASNYHVQFRNTPRAVQRQRLTYIPDAIK